MLETRQHGTKTTAIIKDCAYDAIRIILRRHPVTCTIPDVRHMADEDVESRAGEHDQNVEHDDVNADSSRIDFDFHAVRLCGRVWGRLYGCFHNA